MPSPYILPARSPLILPAVVPLGRGLFDRFRRDNNANMGNAETGQLWVQKSGVWSISSNTAVTTSAGNLVTDAGMSEGNFGAKVNTGADGAVRAIGPVLRYQDESNYLNVVVWRSGDGSVQEIRLYKIIATVSTLIASTVMTIAANTTYDVEAKVNNDSVRVLVDSVQKIAPTALGGLLAAATWAGVRVGGDPTGRNCTEVRAVPA